MKKLVFNQNPDLDLRFLENPRTTIVNLGKESLSFQETLSLVYRQLQMMESNSSLLDIAMSSIFILPPVFSSHVFDFIHSFKFEVLFPNGTALCWCDPGAFNSARFNTGRNTNDKDRRFEFSDIMGSNCFRALSAGIVGLNCATARFMAQIGQKYSGSDFLQVLECHSIQVTYLEM